MSKIEQVKGSCLCGAVGVMAESVDSNVGVCHCSMCRKWGGGPLLAVDCATEVAFTGDEHISLFASSMWAQRGFCNKCGTHLFYQLTEKGQYIMPVGLFDIDEQLQMDHQIFIDEKPQYYCFANETKNMTGAEVFAEFAPPSL
jgi:hypothetical protein